MKVVVTGAAGFIGSHLVEGLLKKGGIDVIGIDSFTDAYDPTIKAARVRRIVSPRFTFHAEDLLNSNLPRLFDDASVVFHLAGQAGVRTSWGSDFRSYTDRNILVTQRLLEFVHQDHPVDRFVNASSSSVYGNAQVYPVTEAVLPRPFSPYGVTKLAAEHLCGLYAENYGVPTVSLRYFTVYGPGQRPDMAFSRFISAAQSGQTITINGNGSQIRDFTYVGDVVRANIAAGFTRNVAPGSVFNVCGGSAVTVATVLDRLRDISGTRLRIVHSRSEAGDVFQTGGASDAARNALFWSPQTDIDSGLRAQWQAAKDQSRPLTRVGSGGSCPL